MNILANWVIGFLIWLGGITLLALVTYLLTHHRIETLRGHIPDEAFDYNYRPNFIPKDAYLMDFHSHTIASDGWMTPEQNIRWHVANGYNAFALTDHNTGKNNEAMLKLQAKYPEILLIPGYEWTTDRVHFNLLGIVEFPKPRSNSPTDEEIQSVIKQAKDYGAIIQIDHISWTMDQPRLRSRELIHPTRDQLFTWGVDGFEINNEMRWYDPLTLHWLDNLKKKGDLSRSVFLSTGTDIHSPLKEWATCWTEILLTPTERAHPTWSIIKQALLEGRTRIWVDHDYRRPNETKFSATQQKGWQLTLFGPLFGLEYGITHLPGKWKGFLSYILWYTLAYFPLRLLFILIENI